MENVDRLGVFLNHVIEKRQPDIDDVLQQQTALAARAINQLISSAYAHDGYFRRTFDWKPLKGKPNEEGLEAIDFDHFTCRLFLKRFSDPESCVCQTGPQYDLLPGIGTCRLSGALTPQQRMAVRGEWSACMDERGYIGPAMIIPWFTECLTNALQKLKTKDRDIEGSHKKRSILERAEITPCIYCVKLKVYSDAGHAVTIRLVPAIRCTGWPAGAFLQHVLPKQRPYADEGKKHLQYMEDRIHYGQSMWTLDAGPVVLDTRVLTAKRFRDGMRRVHHAGRFWKVNFAGAESALRTCLQKSKLSNGRNLLNVWRFLLILKIEHSLACLSLTTLQTLILWAFKKHASQVTELGPCVMYVLEFIRDSLRQRSVPNFFLPNVNMASGLDLPSSTQTALELDVLLCSMRDKPGTVLQYGNGYCKDE